jgi:hypothetical protein
MNMHWKEIGRFQKEVREKIRPGVKIIKPRSRSRITGWQPTGQDERIFYSTGEAGNEKHIYLSELCKAYKELIDSDSGELNHDWFTHTMPRANEAPCDYSTIEAILVYLGYALYDPRGVYRRAVP